MVIRQGLCVVAAVGLLLAVTQVVGQAQGAAPAGAQAGSQAASPRPFPWWKSEPFKKELGLTADQSARIDKIWENTRPELRQESDALSTLEAKLSRMIQADADEAALTRQIDRVETARAAANKTRSLMLVQMVKVLTTEQRTRFTALHERWLQEQGPPGRSSDPQRRQ